MFWTKNKHPKCHIGECEDCQWLDTQNHCCSLKKTAKINQCDFCRNAYNDMRLHGKEDDSSISIGNAQYPYKLFLSSSSHQKKAPVLIEVLTSKNMPDNQNHTVAFYTPKYCPECGRKIIENNKKGD